MRNVTADGKVECRNVTADGKVVCRNVTHGTQCHLTLSLWDGVEI